VSLANVKKMLADEEHQKASITGADVTALDITASSLIINALEIEESQ
jgi:hypothetical protein